MDRLDVLWAIISKWLELAPVLLGLLLTISELKQLRNSQKVANQFAVTAYHRDIWSEMYRNPALARVLERNVDLRAQPLTSDESLFVTFLILHLKTTFRANSYNLITPAKAIERDVKWFFNLPIPREVWNRSISLQDEEFVTFVDGIMRS